MRHEEARRARRPPAPPSVFGNINSLGGRGFGRRLVRLRPPNPHLAAIAQHQRAVNDSTRHSSPPSKAASFFGATNLYESRISSRTSDQSGFRSSHTPTQPLGPTYGGTK